LRFRGALMARCASLQVLQCVGERMLMITAARVPNQTTSAVAPLMTLQACICLST